MPIQSRGQAEVIGLVLLLGVSVIVISGAVVLGGQAISETTTMAEVENAENSISHVESEMSAVSVGDSESRRVSLSDKTEGVYDFNPDAGSVTITYTVDGTEEWGVSRSLGALTYTSSGETVAYQAGGVWRTEGELTEIVSPPEYHYEDSTLVFPIIQLIQPDSGSDSYAAVTKATELESDSLDYPLTEGSVEIRIQSEYYEGWGEYFTEQTDGSVTVFDSNDTVVTNLVTPDTIRLDNAVSLEESYNPSKTHKKKSKRVVLQDELEDNTPHASSDQLITSEISTASAGNNNGVCLSESGVNAPCTADDGVYYIDGDVDLSEALTLDVSDGDITIAVDGDFDINNNKVDVVGDTDNEVKYYINGSVNAKGNGEMRHASGGDGSQNQLYIRDGFLPDQNGGGTIDFEAVIYAPDSTINTNGNFYIEGALIAEDINVDSNSGKIRRGNIPEDEVIDVTGAGDTIEYVHVTTNRVAVELVNTDVYLSSYTPTVDNQCQWVRDNYNSGDISMTGQEVQCDISAGIDDLTVNNIDLSSESVLYGDIDVTGDVDIDSSRVTGSVTGSGDDLTITSDVTVGGDVYTPTGTNLDIDAGSTINGAVVVEGGSLSLDGATINGHVYAAEDDISCDNMELGPDSQSCSAYDFRPPSDY